jgi:Raf kinase inhibitor-like YbhB/YbcL family protein
MNGSPYFFVNTFYIMKITSPSFANNQPVPVKYTCNGPNGSPPFEFIDAPKNTASFVLVVEDLDAPNHWIHWLVYNIPGTTSFFDEGKIPEGAVDGVCNGGTHGYEGPCPKFFSGIHRYSFKLYALDTILNVPENADKGVVFEQFHNHILEEAELVGLAEGEQQPELHQQSVESV